jgi:hypothetical protein
MKRIVITQAVIDQCIAAREGWYNPCPITETLRQRFPSEYILANGTGIHAGKPYRMPSKAQSFIVAWDRYKAVEPITFWLFHRHRPWKRVAMWFKALPSVKKLRKTAGYWKFWYWLKNIAPVRWYRVLLRSLTPIPVGGSTPSA